jgi:hypothetical protein
VKAVSTDFLASVTRSHTAIARVDVYRAGQVLQQGLALVDAKVTLDRTADVMGRCQVTIADPSLIPTGPTSLLAPFGNELRLWRGVRFSAAPVVSTSSAYGGDYTGVAYGGGGSISTAVQTAAQDELVSLGFFRIQSVTVTDPGRSVVITGFDRAQLCKDALFDDTFTIAPGTLYTDAITAVISDCFPGVETSFVNDPTFAPLLVFDGHTSGGHWGAAQSMATSIGCELFFDGDGRLVLRYEPQTVGDPVLSITDGANGVIVTAEKAWSRDQGYNAVIVTSSNPGTNPVRGFAFDSDPASATYYSGPYGKKPKPPVSSPFVTSQDQADTMAAGLLQRSLGAVQSLKFDVVPNPAVEPGDVVQVSRSKLGISEVAVVESVDLGLPATAGMTLTTRTRQVGTGSASTGGRLLYSTTFSDGLGPFSAVTTDSLIFPVTNGSVHLYRPAQVTTDLTGLHIQAQKVGAQWYSGMVTTRLAQGFTPPFRCVWHFRASTAVGMWPTLWWYPWPANPARPEGVDGGWPNSGEGDGFESIGDGRIYMTAHMANPIGSTYPTGYVRLPAIGVQNWVTGDVSAWHTMEYHMIPATGMRWYLDGVLVQSTDAGPLAPRPWADGPWYPRINMAVGSSNGFPPMPDGTTPLSGNMYDVDLFQVWSL